MLFDDALLLELILLTTLVVYLTTTNLTTLLFVAGLYLFILGLVLLLNDADLYVGFLWVIDLGVGLVFFLFIVHFTSFLHQKSVLRLTDRHFLLAPTLIATTLVALYASSLGGYQSHYNDLAQSWFFRITHLDYFTVFTTTEVSELGTIRDSYFLLNSFEFFAINFSLFYGLMTSILLCFLTQRIFAFLGSSQVLGYDMWNRLRSGTYLRLQDTQKQVRTASSVRTWARNSTQTK
jgi:hypothetical protein